MGYLPLAILVAVNYLGVPPGFLDALPLCLGSVHG